jgi:hypothetical protein
MIVSEFRYPEWQIPYHDAVTETDKQSLQHKLLLAECKIFERLQAISGCENHRDERLALADAVDGLRVLEIKKLNYPDWVPSTPPPLTMNDYGASGILLGKIVIEDPVPGDFILPHLPIGCLTGQRVFQK